MLKELIFNPIALSCLFAAVVAQFIKTIDLSRKNSGFHWRYLFIASGFPSAHTATVTALSLGIFLVEGITTLFVVSLVLSFIVIRDVLGDRMFAQQQEDLINDSMHKLFEGEFESIKWNNLIGHSIKEVFWGLILGAVITSLVFYFV